MGGVVPDGEGLVLGVVKTLFVFCVYISLSFSATTFTLWSKYLLFVVNVYVTDVTLYNVRIGG